MCAFLPQNISPEQELGIEDEEKEVLEIIGKSFSSWAYVSIEDEMKDQVPRNECKFQTSVI